MGSNRSNGERREIIGFNCSTFDLFHTGHIAMLKEEKGLCDHLLIAIQTDPTLDRPNKNKPIQSIYERFTAVRACKYVDEVIVYGREEDLMNILKTERIDIRFLGEEYKYKDFTGKQHCLDIGIELYYHARRHEYSSTNLRRRVYTSEKLLLEG